MLEPIEPVFVLPRAVGITPYSVNCDEIELVVVLGSLQIFGTGGVDAKEAVLIVVVNPSADVV